MSTGAQIIPFPTLREGESYKAAHGPLRTKDFEIGEGDQGIADTVAYMNGLSVGDQGAANPNIQLAAQQITAICSAGDQACQDRKSVV